jgi:HAD superfamily hydrolase (TIGR01458 family)
MAWIEGIRGVLLDVEGTLLIGDTAVPGAADCLERLERRGVVWRVTTNTTRRPRSAVAEVLQRAGIDVPPERILVPATLARRRIIDSGHTRAALLVPEPSFEDFEGVRNVTSQPDWVVVGDLGRGFTWDRLNNAFRWLREGAKLVALQKNAFWHAGDDEMQIDAGPFVAALEYAAGVTAEVVGKPERGFFEVALTMIDCDAGSVLVVGDDVVNHGRGGAHAGCQTVLVRTGKFSEQARRWEGFEPSLLLNSVADLGT